MKKIKAFALAAALVASSAAGYLYIKNNAGVIFVYAPEQSVFPNKSLEKIAAQLKKGVAELSLPNGVTEEDAKKVVEVYQLDLLNNPIKTFEVNNNTMTVTYKFKDQEFNEMKKEANKQLNEFLGSIKSYSKEKQLFEIYRFVSQSMSYDQTSSCSPLESFVNEKVGDSNSFAVLFKKCLSLMGIENYYAWDLSTTHVWNIAYIDGEPYHFDTTYEAAGYQGLFFTNFGMSDALRIESSYITDWVVGYSKDFLITNPQCTSDQYRFLYNSYGTILISKDNSLYYVDPTEEFKLKLFNFETRDHEIIDASSVILLREYNHSLYYIDQNFRVSIFDIENQKLYPLGEDNMGYGFQEENGSLYLLTLEDELVPIS